MLGKTAQKLQRRGSKLLFAVVAFLLTSTLSPVFAAGDPPRFSELDGVLSRALSFVFPSAGVVALVMFFYGGFMYMFSNGDPQKVAKAQGVLTWAAVGVVLLFAMYMIIRFVFSSLQVL